MRNSMIIFRKQIKDTLKNKTILIQFILFPIMTLIMENAIKMEGMPDHFFVKLFSIMYIGMAPIAAVASIISEEKEKNTLRVLMMANVKPWQYLTGVGFYVWVICMLGASVMSTAFSGQYIVTYLCFMGIGFIVSIVVGACVGVVAKNQMGATSLVMPAILVFAFAPMLSMFNENISKVAKIFYTQQLRLCLDTMSFSNITKETYLVLCINIFVFIIFFGIAYKRKGLE